MTDGFDERDVRRRQGNGGRLTAHSHAVAWMPVGWRGRFRLGLLGNGRRAMRAGVLAVLSVHWRGCHDSGGRRPVPGMHGACVHRHRLGDDKREPRRQQGT
jgi:hypothetical protein